MVTGTSSFRSNGSRWLGVELGESGVVGLFERAQRSIRETRSPFPKVRFRFANAKLGSFPRRSAEHVQTYFRRVRILFWDVVIRIHPTSRKIGM